MSVFDLLRPKYKHPDPAVRAAAVANLRDQPQLAEIAANDGDERVRTAGLQQLTNEELRAQIARGSSPANVAALEGITGPQWLAALARFAESPTVRGLATERLDDVAVLQKVIAHDPDPGVRRRARLQLGTTACLPNHLSVLLANLDVCPPAPGDRVTATGRLEDVCRALSHDGRFEIDAVLTPCHDAGPAATQTMPPTDGYGPTTARLELLGHARPEPAAHAGAMIHYRVKIWRCGDDAYQWSLSERRSELTNDLEAWAKSSRG